MIVQRPVGFTSLSVLRLHKSADRSDVPVEVPITTTPAGEYVADVDDVEPGRWYPTLSGARADGDTGRYLMEPLDLPIDETLVVSVEALALAAGMSLPLTEGQRATIRGAIADAQADVVAYLGQPITPSVFTQTGAYPWPDGWDLTAHGDSEVIEVYEARAEVDALGAPTGLFTITYAAGLRARTDPALAPIARYVRAHALNSPEFGRVWKAATKARGDVTSLSVTGQSVSFAKPTLGNEGARPGDGSPGALPTLASLDYWRVAGRRVHQARTRSPYTYEPGWWVR